MLDESVVEEGKKKKRELKVGLCSEVSSVYRTLKKQRFLEDCPCSTGVPELQTNAIPMAVKERRNSG